jgi:hypothetical protein
MSGLPAHLSRKRSISNTSGTIGYSLHGASSTSPNSHQNVIRTINKLFSERLDIYVLPNYKDLNVNYIMDSFLRIFIKVYSTKFRQLSTALTKYVQGFVEVIRLSTIHGVDALHQVQIDVEFLRTLIYKYALDER